MLSSLRFKIPAATITLTLASMATVAVLSWNSAREEIVGNAYTKLGIIARAQVMTLRTQFQQAQVEFENLLANPSVTGNASDLIENFDPQQADFRIIQETFSALPEGGDALEISDTIRPTAYGRGHKRIHGSLRRLLNKPGYADVLLIDGGGRIVYTARKDRDFGRSASDASFATQPLMSIFQRLKDGPGNTPLFEDFGPYPIGAEPSAFLGSTIFRRANVAMGTSQEATRVGYLVIRLTPAFLDASAAFKNGLGQSGDILVLGQDRALRAPSRYYDSGAIGRQASDIGLSSIRAERRLAFMSPSGVQSLAVSEPATIMGSNWSVVATQSRAEALDTLGKLSLTLATIVVVVGLLSILIALQLANRFVRPLTLLTGALRALSRKERIDEIPGIRRGDEIGAIAQAVLRIRDVTAEQANASAELYKRLSEENGRLANFDVLTGLLNRRGFFAGIDTLGEPTRDQGRTPAVLLMDLDGFKPINDRYGHAAGDQVLAEVARRVRVSLTDEALIARLGGDEFAVYLRGATVPQVRSYARAVLASMKPTIDLGDGIHASVGISIGIYVSDDHKLNIGSMLEHADTALYSAKNQGRNIWRQYSPTMLAESQVANFCDAISA